VEGRRGEEEAKKTSKKESVKEFESRGYSRLTSPSGKKLGFVRNSKKTESNKESKSDSKDKKKVVRTKKKA